MNLGATGDARFFHIENNFFYGIAARYEGTSQGGLLVVDLASDDCREIASTALTYDADVFPELAMFHPVPLT